MRQALRIRGWLGVLLVRAAWESRPVRSSSHPPRSSIYAPDANGISRACGNVLDCIAEMWVVDHGQRHGVFPCRIPRVESGEMVGVGEPGADGSAAACANPVRSVLLLSTSFATSSPGPSLLLRRPISTGVQLASR